MCWNTDVCAQIITIGCAKKVTKKGQKTHLPLSPTFLTKTLHLFSHGIESLPPWLIPRSYTSSTGFPNCTKYEHVDSIIKLFSPHSSYKGIIPQWNEACTVCQAYWFLCRVVGQSLGHFYMALCTSTFEGSYCFDYSEKDDRIWIPWQITINIFFRYFQYNPSFRLVDVTCE